MVSRVDKAGRQAGADSNLYNRQKRRGERSREFRSGLAPGQTTPRGSLGFLFLDATVTDLGFSRMHLSHARTQMTEALPRMREGPFFLFTYRKEL